MRVANWVRHTKPSFIREILSFTQQPGVISFAGGMPAPELFPVDAVAQAYQKVLQQHAQVALQYSPSEGEQVLRRAVADRLAQDGTGIAVTAEEVLITNGSQHGLDLIAKVLLRPGDVVLVESPTYIGALQAFAPYHPLVVPVASDAEGMTPDALADAIRVHQPAFVYLVPTFQNPTGQSMGLMRRQQIVAVCKASDVPIVEDDPYRDLRYSGTPLPALKALWDQVIYLGTVSKIIAPGLRTGWLVAPQIILQAAKLAIQSTCLNVGAITQYVVADLLQHPDTVTHIQRLRRTYGERMHCMMEALADTFPDETQVVAPEGGLFLWVTLPSAIRTDDVLHAALRQGVAFVPGQPFFVYEGGEHSMRLNFSYANPEQIQLGMQRLGAAIASLSVRVTVS